MPRIEDIIRFWFDRLPHESGTGSYRKVWFAKDPAFDQEIETRFRSVYEQAAAGKLDHWQETAIGSLALILLLDQFPRNLFRGQSRAFATDDKALAIAQRLIDQGRDQDLPPIQRWFVYLPLMHSENLDHQNQCVELFETLRENPEIESAYIYALKHRDVIEQFGRFPHRNPFLGRTTTPEEAEFLKQPGSSF